MDLENFELDPIDIGLDGFSFDEFTADVKEIKQARALRTRSRILKRRAQSENTLKQILPVEIESGDSWHVISQGDIDSLSYFSHILSNENLEYALLSTWCMSIIDAQVLGDYISTGKIDRLDCYVGEIFPKQYPDAFSILSQAVRKCAGRVAVFRNHSKIFIGSNNRFKFVIESSANINTNPRTEQTAIHASAELFDFYKEFYDGIQSFQRDFDDWKKFEIES